MRKRKYIKGSSDNVRRALRLADRIDIEEGRVAYFRYREVMEGMARYYSYPLEYVTAAFCALSPNNDYLGNLRSVVTLIRGRERGASVEDCYVSTYNACKRRAWKYLEGADFLALTTGKKTRAFYQNILNPEDPHPVTIDGHAVSAWAGIRLTMKAVATRGFHYETVAQSYREVASEPNLFTGALLPNQLQAILWFTWKRLHRVKYNGNLNLFDTSDNWGTLYHAEDIKPF